MTPSEAAVVLSVAASFDRRQVGETDAQAWAAALPWVSMAEARDAVVAHYSGKRDWIMPADVSALVRINRRKRIADMTTLTMPPELADDPRAESQWAVTVRRGVASGMTQDEAVEDACRRFRVAVPVVPPALPGHVGRLRQLMGGPR